MLGTNLKGHQERLANNINALEIYQILSYIKKVTPIVANCNNNDKNYYY